MKITINVDCTPEEARTFMGLPDVKPMQDALMRDVEARLRGALDSMDGDALMKTWMSAGLQGVEHLQKVFWPYLVPGGAKDDKP